MSLRMVVDKFYKTESGKKMFCYMYDSIDGYRCVYVNTGKNYEYPGNPLSYCFLSNGTTNQCKESIVSEWEN